MSTALDAAREAVAFYDAHPESPAGYLASALIDMIDAFEALAATRDPDWYDTHCPTCDAPEPEHSSTCAVIFRGSADSEET